MIEERQIALDMGRLISRVRETIKGLQTIEREAAEPDALQAFAGRMQEAPESAKTIVLAEDTAVELGCPSRASVNAVIWTRAGREINDGRVSLIGPDLPHLTGAERDYAQIVMLGLTPEAELDPFQLESPQYLTRRLPGVMARMIPGRLWLRGSREAMAQGLDFALIGGALRRAYLELAQGIAGVETIFVTQDRETVERFSPLASEAKILAGQHRKVALAASGDYECEELNCESCDEKPVCDQIREVVTIKRRQRQESGREGGAN